MASHPAHLDDAKDIRMVFQRICRAGGMIHLKHDSFIQDFPVYAELEDRVVVGITDVVRGQWGLKPGAHLMMALEDRGRRYEAVVEMSGHGRYEGLESCAFEHPRVLKCTNDERLSDYQPDRPLPCTYSTHALEIKDGKARAFGAQGVELVWVGADTKSGGLKVGDETVLELVLGKGERLVLPARVAHFGDGFAGLHVQERADPAAMASYRQWLEESLRGQRARDQQGFEAKGVKASGNRSAEAELARPGGGARLLVDRDPLLLVISEGDGFPRRMAEALGKKYGVAFLDYVQGKVHPTLSDLGANGETWGRLRLLLVHQRLRVSSGLELTRELSVGEGCPLPILVVGHEDDVALKRNRAIAAGAVDFISVEPFHVLRVMRVIEDTLKMFG